MVRRKSYALTYDTLETDIKSAIRKLLEYSGFEVQYIIPQRNNKHGKGVADIAAMKNGTTYWIEVKRPDGVQDDWQKAFQEKCERAGVTYIIAKCLDDVKQIIENSVKS